MGTLSLINQTHYQGHIIQVYENVGRPYIRKLSYSFEEGEESYHWITCSPLASLLSSKTKIWVVDLTYSETLEGDLYLMNVVIYCEELKKCLFLFSCNISKKIYKYKQKFKGIAGPRGRVKGKHTRDYLAALRSIIQILQEDNPGFELTSLDLILIDFEVALLKAFKEILGEESSRILKGCNVSLFDFFPLLVFCFCLCFVYWFVFVFVFAVRNF